MNPDVAPDYDRYIEGHRNDIDFYRWLHDKWTRAGCSTFRRPANGENDDYTFTWNQARSAVGGTAARRRVSGQDEALGPRGSAIRRLVATAL